MASYIQQSNMYFARVGQRVQHCFECNTASGSIASYYWAKNE